MEYGLNALSSPHQNTCDEPDSGIGEMENKMRKWIKERE
jgi:hypothetical protein